MTTLFHLLVHKFIWLYKGLEFQILSLFSGFVERSLYRKLEQIGVVCEIDGIKNSNYEHILEKCKYEKVCRIQLKDKRLLTQVANRGYIAMGEGYLNGNFKFTNDENDITEFITRCLSNNYFRYYFNFWNSLLHNLEFEWINLQTTSNAWEVGKRHYDLGDSFFSSFLDTNMQYSCGYWANADNLEKAQIDKMNLVARKLDLKPGMRVLDLGCGWGTLCKYLVDNFGVECVGVTVSEEGCKYAKEVCKGLPVEILLEDYRKINQKFDRILSIEMFEHVGHRNHRDFFEVVHRCLKDDGIFLLHTTAITDSTLKRVDTWIHTYVYPNMSHPFVYEISKGSDGLFIIEDWHNMTIDFLKTFMAWRENFIKNWPTICKLYDDQLYRMWTYLMSLSCAGYKSKKYQLAQVIFTKAQFQRRYNVVR